MKIQNVSGAVYWLKDIELEPEADPSADNGLAKIMQDHIGRYTAQLARLGGVPMVEGSWWPLADPLNPHEDVEFHKIQFVTLPEVGKCFYYQHELWNGCRSSTVGSIIDDDEDYKAVE